MTKIPIFILLVITLQGCSNINSNPISFEKGDKIDLTDIDAVRENLNGFWIDKEHIERNILERFNFEKNLNISAWESIPYDEGSYQNKEVPLASHPPIVELIMINHRVHLFVFGMSGSDTILIEDLHENRLVLAKTSYLRHRGYNFMKNWESNKQ